MQGTSFSKTWYSGREIFSCDQRQLNFWRDISRSGSLLTWKLPFVDPWVPAKYVNERISRLSGPKPDRAGRDLASLYLVSKQRDG
jgi:hypothetical protein